MNIKLTLLVIFSILLCARADNYAVIVAGSNGFSNYRHQADACHAYNLLISNGVPADNIILMAYNDIAFNTENPLQGELHNAPSGDKPGRNFYKDCVFDYEGDDVTKDNYFAVLKGNKDAVVGGSGRVLESGPNDEVFLVYSDHGNQGFVCFPNPHNKPSSEVYLYADELLEVLQDMYKAKKYQTLAYYMSACHSGSMFQDLPDDINVYALTAANASQSGWGCFCPPGGDKVRSVKIDTCLSSQFPASWLYNSEFFNTNKESLQTQYELVKTTTTSSEVQQWGTFDFVQWPISKFMGGKNQDSKILGASLMQRIFSFYENMKGQIELFEGINEHVEEQRHIETNYVMRRYKKSPTQENYHKLQEMLAQNSKFDQIFKSFIEKHQLEQSYEGKTNFDCYKKAILSLENQCGQFNDYGLHFAQYLYQYCGKYADQQQELVFDC